MINVNILKIKYYSYLISIAMIFAFVGGILYKKYYTLQKAAFLYSVEFAGGYQLGTHISPSEAGKQIETEELKHALELSGYQGVSIRSFGDNRFLLRFPMSEKLVSHQSEEFVLSVKNNIKMIFPDASCTIEDCVYVGSGVGDNLWSQGLLAIFIAIVMMFMYVWIRFPSWHFSFANLISLMHDVLVILLFLLWSNVEISLDVLISILFIIGYSINDTIVIFSVIREQMKSKQHSICYDSIINKSIQLTLRRTLLTSFFTALVVVPLWLFGGHALQALAVPILLGIIFGTYSSIAIASTVLHDTFKICK
jgi:preprotein translocase subunit SecF